MGSSRDWVHSQITQEFFLVSSTKSLIKFAELISPCISSKLKVYKQYLGVLNHSFSFSHNPYTKYLTFLSFLIFAKLRLSGLFLEESVQRVNSVIFLQLFFTWVIMYYPFFLRLFYCFHKESTERSLTFLLVSKTKI